MHAVLELSSLYTFSEPAGGTEVRLHDGVDQRHRGRGSGASGRARLLAQAVAGMGRPSMRGHSCAAVHLREPFDGVSCSAPCRLVGSTASCEAQPVSLCARWAHASVRAGRYPSARSYAEFPHSTSTADLLQRVRVGQTKRAMVNRAEYAPPSRACFGWRCSQTNVTACLLTPHVCQLKVQPKSFGPCSRAATLWLAAVTVGGGKHECQHCCSHG